MMPGRRDDLGEILPIDVRQQPFKVAKHLYNPAERWDALVGVEVKTLVEEARARGFDASSGDDAAPMHDSTAAVVMRRHHDMHYGPAYLRSLAAASTRWAPQPSEGPSRALAHSADGVLIAFDRAPRCKVVTAFRPDLPSWCVHPKEHDFALAAKSRWSHAVRRTDPQLEEQELTDALAGDRGDPMSAWRLAVALGRARSSAREVASAPVADAAARFEETSAEVRAGLLDARDEDSRLDALADALQEGDGTEVLDRLIALEDLLAASIALGEEERAERLIEETAVRVSCAGPEFARLVAYAESRASSTKGASGRYWREVGDEILANALRLAPPVRGTRDVMSVVLGWLREALSSTRATLTELVVGWSAEPLLTSRAHAREVVVRGHVRAPSLRAFVVDQEHPKGEEVTDLLRLHNEEWSLEGWQVDPGDEAVLVVVSGGPEADSAPSLAELLARVDASHEVDAVSLTDAR